MSAAYLVAGLLLGFLAGKAPLEWQAVLILMILAGAALIVGWSLESKGSTR